MTNKPISETPSLPPPGRYGRFTILSHSEMENPTDEDLACPIVPIKPVHTVVYMDKIDTPDFSEEELTAHS